MTDSTAAGYLASTSLTDPSYDDPLDDVLHDVLVGLTGIPAALVRPRWQPVPPVQPDAGVSWIAFGINSDGSDTFAYATHVPAGTGTDHVERTESLTVLVSCYGPAPRAIAHAIIDALALDQNRAALRTIRASVVECSEVSSVPSLVNDKWLKRADFSLYLRRYTIREYQVRSLISAGVDIDNERYITHLTSP